MTSHLDKYFLSHPHSVGESYLEHAGVAANFSFRLLGASLAALVHALVPCLFEKTASSAIKSMHAKIVSRGSPR